MNLRDIKFGGDLYRNRCEKKIQRKEPVSNALLSQKSSSPVPNLGRTVVIGERFWREGPRVGGGTLGQKDAGAGRRPGAWPQSLQPSAPPTRARSCTLRLGGRGAGRARRRPARSSARRPQARRGAGAGRNAPSRPRPPALPRGRSSPTSAGLRSPW